MGKQSKTTPDFHGLWSIEEPLNLRSQKKCAHRLNEAQAEIKR